MAQIQVRMNLRGLNQIMTSDAVQEDLDARGKRMAAAAGEGFEYTRGQRRHSWIARGYVQANTRAASVRQAREAVLQRAMDAGR